MLNKKAQGMSMNIIVVAAIALLILIIIIAIFASRMGKFASTQDSCDGKGGTCGQSTYVVGPPARSICNANYVKVGDCSEAESANPAVKKACCVKLGT
jgi:hypothetical protein